MAKILMVDDEVALCELLATVLEMNGHEVVCRNGGYEAIELLKKDRFDIVLSDIRMPLGNGFILAEWLEANQPALPVIFMSGGSTFEKEKSGFFKSRPYMAKPIKHEDLLRVINKILTSA